MSTDSEGNPKGTAYYTVCESGKRDKVKMDDTLEFSVTFETEEVTINNMRLTRVDHNLYSIEETPILIDCASYKDIIEADLQPDGSLIFRRVVKKSEMQTHDFLLSKEVIDSEGFASLLDRVTEAEGHWEIVFGGCVFIYLPSGCTLDPTQEIEDICNKPIRARRQTTDLAPRMTEATIRRPRNDGSG